MILAKSNNFTTLSAETSCVLCISSSSVGAYMSKVGNAKNGGNSFQDSSCSQGLNEGSIPRGGEKFDKFDVVSENKAKNPNGRLQRPHHTPVKTGLTSCSLSMLIIVRASSKAKS